MIGRALNDEEVRHFQEAARRIAATLLLGPELDALRERGSGEGYGHAHDVRSDGRMKQDDL